MIETYPLAKAAEAYERMMSGKARFRVVLVAIVRYSAGAMLSLPCACGFAANFRTTT